MCSPLPPAPSNQNGSAVDDPPAPAAHDRPAPSRQGHRVGVPGANAEKGRHRCLTTASTTRPSAGSPRDGSNVVSPRPASRHSRPTERRSPRPAVRPPVGVRSGAIPSRLHRAPGRPGASTPSIHTTSPREDRSGRVPLVADDQTMASRGRPSMTPPAVGWSGTVLERAAQMIPCGSLHPPRRGAASAIMAGMSSMTTIGMTRTTGTTAPSVDMVTTPRPCRMGRADACWPLPGSCS